jgi:hypothetical protein
MTATIPRKKSDVLRDYHGRASRDGHDRPALNVKVYAAPEYTAERIRAEFHCSEAAAGRAAEWCYESAQEDFWRDAALDCLNYAMLGADKASDYKPCGLRESPYKVYAEGNSGGWLVVDGLASVETWDGATFQKWRKFARLINQEIALRLTFEYARDMIEANEWCPKVDTIEGAAEDVRAGDSAKLAKVARDIHKVMNGTEWGADTHEAVADCFTQHGFEVADYEGE